MDKTAWTASPVVVARKSRLRKAFPGDGYRGDMAEEPMVQQAGTPAESPVLLQVQTRQGKHPYTSFLPCCITWCLAPPHKIGLVKAFQLREHVWKNIIIIEVFMFSGKGAKLELPRQEISFCFIVMTVAEGQTDQRSWGSLHCRPVPITWFQAKNQKSSKSNQLHKIFFLKIKLLHVPVTQCIYCLNVDMFKQVFFSLCLSVIGEQPPEQETIKRCGQQW